MIRKSQSEFQFRTCPRNDDLLRYSGSCQPRGGEALILNTRGNGATLIGMRVIYTKHVELRIIQRSLGRARIHATTLNPDRVLPGELGCVLCQKDFGGRTLEVVCRRLRTKVIVVTAYWLKEA